MTQNNNAKSETSRTTKDDLVVEASSTPSEEANPKGDDATTLRFFREKEEKPANEEEGAIVPAGDDENPATHDPDIMPLPSLNRGRNVVANARFAPGAVAVAGIQGQQQRVSDEEAPPQDGTNAVADPDANANSNDQPSEHLLEAHLVEEESNHDDNNIVVEAKPAETGIGAFVYNPYFKYVAACFLIIIIAITVPLAVISGNQQNSNSVGNEGNNILDGKDSTTELANSNANSNTDLEDLELEETTSAPDDGHCGIAHLKFSDYRGFVNETVSGLPCQAWDSQFPHEHTNGPEDRPNAGLEENYCRNPDGDIGGAWCYTNTSAVRYEYCDVPRCKDQKFRYGCGTPASKQADYRGNVSVSASGKVCQRWDSQYPHPNPTTPEAYPEGDLEENYCRNPNGEPRAYCLTTDNNTWWETCLVPWCSDDGSLLDSDEEVGLLQGSTSIPYALDVLERRNYFESPKHNPSRCGSAKLFQYDYRGNKNVTVSGRECQPWNLPFPHNPSYTSSTYATAGLQENYCRNPNALSLEFVHTQYAWCYTMDPDKRWEYCDIDHCEEEMEFRCGQDAGLVDCQEECGTADLLQQDYRGNVSTTVSGMECAVWAETLPHLGVNASSEGWSDEDLASNYCRNPDGWPGGRAWCYTTAPLADIRFPSYAKAEVRWEACAVPMC